MKPRKHLGDTNFPYNPIKIRYSSTPKKLFAVTILSLLAIPVLSLFL